MRKEILTKYRWINNKTVYLLYIMREWTTKTLFIITIRRESTHHYHLFMNKYTWWSTGWINSTIWSSRQWASLVISTKSHGWSLVGCRPINSLKSWTRLVDHCLLSYMERNGGHSVFLFWKISGTQRSLVGYTIPRSPEVGRDRS